MGNTIYLTILLNILLLAFIQSAPIPESVDSENFCEVDGLLKFSPDKDYFYEYKTKTLLWINNVSKDSKSTVDLTANVRVRNVRDCTYQLVLESVQIDGESVNQADVQSLISNLKGSPSFFRLNQLGQVHPTVQFLDGDSNWSRNVKRGIISTLQTFSANNLHNFENEAAEKSALIYETDVLGRCRTTYSVKNSDYVPEKSSFKLEKKKDLHSCSLNSTVKTANVQYVRYRNLPEFYQGRLFVETYECDSEVENGVVSKVECEQKSTYKIGSNGDKGAQAVVESSLKLTGDKAQRDKMASGLDSAQPSSINIELTDNTVDESEYQNFDLNGFLDEVCSNLEQDGLNDQHSNNFRRLVKYLRTKSSSELLGLYETANGKCQIAGQTFAQALLFGDSETTIEATLSLLDKDVFSSQRYISEFPILTALTRTQNPSLNVLNRLKNYISSKDNKFQYLRKLYLVYSSLIRVYCDRNECSDNDLNNWTSLFAANLGSNCADSTNQDLVTSSLKAIGNVGQSSANTPKLLECAKNKQNSLEVRINAIQALRDFECKNYMNDIAGIISNHEDDDDTEVEINAFLVLVKCIQTEEFKTSAETLLAKYLSEEDDIQVLTFIVDYAKEHGLTAFLNPILANPKIKERFSVNFKELSWNNYRNRYSVMRDSGYELETSVIYAPRSWIPRSIRFNVTLHAFGMSINFIDVNLRVQGLTDVLKGVFIDRITSEEFLKQISENPDQLADLLQSLADKLKFEPESPSLSLSIRTYGADVYYSELNTIDQLRKLALFLRNREQILYSQVNNIKNYYLVDSRVRHPLSNGLEFNSFFDITGGLYILKRSSKTDEEDKRDFSIKNFYSLSGSVNKRIEVLLTPQSRLSLKKVVYLNTRVNLNVDGTKTGDTAIYKINLPNTNEISLFTLDGRFYKLTSNGQYVEINDFSVEQKNFNNCTSHRFHDALGVDLCLTIKRPRTGGLREILKTFDLNNQFNYDDFDNDDEEHDHDHDNDGDQDHDHEDHENEDYYKRPKLTLSGPYHYNVLLKNPDLINKIILQFTSDRNEENNSYELVGTVKSETNGYAQDRFVMDYKRSKSYTNRGFERKVDFELRVPSTNEVRFKLNTLLAYKKQELINLHFNLDNKILRELHLELEVKREKGENNVIGEYKLEALLDSHIRNHRQYRVFIDVVPENKNIKSYLVVERKDDSTDQQKVQLIDGLLTLNHADSDQEVDYDVDLQIETYTQKTLHLYGHLGASLFDSNIDLSLEFTNSSLSHPVNIRCGHHFDGSSRTKSFVELAAKLPNTRLNHAVKVLFQVELPKLSFNYLEFQLRTVSSGETPYSVFVGRNVDQESGRSEYEGGIQNFNIDLSQRTSTLAATLVKVDGDKFLKSLVFKFTRVYDEAKKTLEHQLLIEKNGNQFSKLNTNFVGSLTELRRQLNNQNGEIASQDLSASIKAKVLEYAGSMSGKLSLEAARSRGYHRFNFEFDSENLFRILLKVISIRTKFVVENSKIDASYDVLRLGEVRSVSLKSTNGQIRVIGNEKQFDISYEKKLSSGESFTGEGVASYSFNDFKNFLVKFDVPNKFDFRINGENSKNSDLSLGVHDLQLSYNHRDYQPFGRVFNVRVENNTESVRNYVVNLLFKDGTPDKMDDISSLKTIVEVKTKNHFQVNENGERVHLDGDNSFLAKINTFNFETRYNNKRRRNDNVVSNEFDVFLKFPSKPTDPSQTLTGKANFNHNRATGALTLTHNFETNHDLLSKYVKNSELTFNRQVDAVTKIGTSVLNIDLNGKQNNINVKVESDCLTGGCKSNKVSFRQNIVPSWKSVLASGKTLQISSCSYSRRLERVKEQGKYLLDTALVVECGEAKLLNGAILISRVNNDDLPETELSFEGESDLYFEKRSLRLKHRKFSQQNGLVAFGFESAKLNSKFSTEFKYVRELDQVTNRLAKGEYVLTTSTGVNYNKVCTLNIESKDNYYNSLTCRVSTPTFGESSYGYAMKVNEVKEYLFGRRSLELNVNLPGRTLRFDYDGYATNPLNANKNNDAEGYENDEREFNGTFRYFWDYTNDQSKVLTVNLKRDNYALGESKTNVDLIFNGPNLKSVNFEIKRLRKSNETQFEAFLSYDLANGKSNRLNVNAVLASDLNTNLFRIEENLQRPAFNVLYGSKFNKYNGRLLHSQFRAAKLVSFNIEKDDLDPRSRRISLELNAPSEQYSIERTESFSSGVYTVVTKLNQDSSLLSTLTSKFDSQLNVFTAELDGSKVGEKYTLKFNLFNQTVATANIVKNEKDELARANIQLNKASDYNSLVLSLRWNRFWKSIQLAALGKSESALNENEKFNSYLGDVYAVLSEDLKPAFDNIRTQRQGVRESLKKLGLVLGDFYLNVSPTLKGLATSRLVAVGSTSEDDSSNQPLYIRAFRRYNKLAKDLTDISLFLRKYSKRLSTYVPRLPVMEYNKSETDKNLKPFANNLVVSRPTLNADNLYQFYAEQRYYMKSLGETVLSIKGNLLRDFSILRIKTLINKYKLRSLSDYTLVGVVYNKRNVISLAGNSLVLKSKCKFLLAHELRRREFSVVVNNQDNALGIVTVLASGQAYDISYDKALVGGQQVALPYSAELKNNRNVLITKTNSGVCIKVHKDLKVCCHEDSRSCSIAMTRWFSGKVNGLLGSSSTVNENFSEEFWSVGECKIVNLQLKKPSEEAVKSCYSIFGQHRKAFFTNSFGLIKPDGWRSICEHVLSNDPKGKCPLMRAFVYNAKLRNIEVDEPNECYTCQLGDRKFNIGEKVSKDLSSNLKTGTDYVYMVLPCEKTYSLESLSKLAKKQQANKNNRQYIIKVGVDEPSIYQDGTILNADVSKANLTEDSTQQVTSNSFYQAIHLALHLFSQRVASQRRLVIVSCGNCLDYSSFAAIRTARLLNERNVIVTSWGLYSMTDLNNSGEDQTSEVIIGYNADNVFLYKSDDNAVDADGADGYKVEHKGDLCSRLAVKTEGNVFDINYVKESKVMTQAVKKLEENKVNYKTTINRCERVDTVYGDLDDFSITRTREN